MKNHSSSDQDYELWILLNQVRDVLLKAREKELRPHGVTTTQAAALFIIETTGNEATAIEISRWLLREHHSVSGLLSRMEKEGLTQPEYTLTEDERLGSTKKDAPYWWRVRAIDGASNMSGWSAAKSFAVGFVLTIPDLTKYLLGALGGLLFFFIAFLLVRRRGKAT